MWLLNHVLKVTSPLYALHLLLRWWKYCTLQTSCYCMLWKKFTTATWSSGLTWCPWSKKGYYHATLFFLAKHFLNFHSFSHLFVNVRKTKRMMLFCQNCIVVKKNYKCLHKITNNNCSLWSSCCRMKWYGRIYGKNLRLKTMRYVSFQCITWARMANSQCYLTWDFVYFQILETYRKIVAAKQKRKPLSKSERDVAWKAVRDREILVKSLDALEKKWWNFVIVTRVKSCSGKYSADYIHICYQSLVNEVIPLWNVSLL